MAEPKTLQELIHDISLLYELALEIGQTLDVQESCERFLRRLMTRKSQDQCILWVDTAELRENNPVEQMEILYAYPRPDVPDDLLRSTPLWQSLRQARVLSLTNDDPLLQDMPPVINTKEDGIHNFITLKDFGCVYLHSRIAKKPWGKVVQQQLAGLAERFAVSLHACYNHQVLVNETHARRRAEQELDYRAKHDDLTGLMNRAYARQWLEQRVQGANGDRRPFVLMYLDLDRFKNLNDTMGHLCGDLALKEIARRIVRCVRQQDLVARLGGDEFLVVLAEVEDEEFAEGVAGRIIESCSAPLDLDEKIFFLGCSIGMTFYPQDCSSVELLMSHADSAMYEAKRSGRNCFRRYHEDLDEALKWRLSIEDALRNALSNQEFHLVYQPIVDLKNGKLVGLEALLRWSSPKIGAVSPSVYIPIAEETGTIVDIGAWVLRQAALDAVRVRQLARDKDLFMSVNVSSVQLKSLGFEQTVQQVLEESGLPPRALHLEITEHMLLDENPATQKSIERLIAMELELTIDDFGTGYSALNYLLRIPHGMIKIDRSFIHVVTEGNRHASLVKAIIEMAHALGRPIIAEGIETDMQRSILKHFDCDMGQGYLFGRPMPLQAVFNWIARSAPV